MKNKKLISGLLIVMLLAMTALFAGCGGPSTLEEWISSDSEAQATLEEMSTDELDVTVEGNTLVYTYTYAQVIDASLVDAVSQQLDETITNSSSTFTNVADTLEEESGIDGITVQVIYLNGDGTELLNKTF